MNGIFILAVFLPLFVTARGERLKGLPTHRPLNIAHRGSSGMLPEHTVAAYQLAVDQGADIIECDLALTKDLQFICSHDATLNSTTDVHSHIIFRNREETYLMDGRPVTDYFTVDFTMAELKTLRKIQVRSYRDQSHNGEFPMASLDENIAVAKNASRPVGIYPETKTPQFFNRILSEMGHDTTMEDLLMTSLDKHGYNDTSSPCLIQSFYIPSLVYMSSRTPLPLICLTGTSLTDQLLSNYSDFCYGIGPSKNTIVRVVSDEITEVTDFLERAHSYGLKVHPFTFRNEYMYLANDYGADPYREYEKFVDLGVDGLFTDFPWSFDNYLQAKYSGGAVASLTYAGKFYYCVIVALLTTVLAQCSL